MQPYGQLLAPGTVLGHRYRILSLLGQGGMGAVYQAQDLRLGLVAALKENWGGDPRQFQQEALILARLRHSNLPRVSDHFVEPNGAQYFVMEYIDGEDLEAMVKRVGPRLEANVLGWIDQILDALIYLHNQQPPVIHRDIKPANIKITPQGKAILVDFGIAKTADPRLGTLTGARAVTPGYAPPEQYGLHTDPRSDVYALGATLYTALTGQVPPESPLRTSGAVALIPPRQIVAAISPGTEGAILRAMETDMAQRWQSASEFRAALHQPIQKSTIPVPGGPSPRASASGISPSWVIPILLALIAATLFLIIALALNKLTPNPVAIANAATLTDTPVDTPPFTPTVSETRNPIETLTALDVASPTPENTSTVIVVPSATPAPTSLPSPTWTWTPVPARPTNTSLPVVPPRAQTALGCNPIAFVSSPNRDPVPAEIDTINPDGTNRRTLLTSQQLGLSSLEGAAWSPNGTRLAFAAKPEGSDHRQIYVVNADGSGPVRLTSPLQNRDTYHPSWSPDGSRLVVSSSSQTSASSYTDPDAFIISSVQAEQYLNNTAFDNPQRGAGGVAWSPDGQWVVYTSTDPSKNADVYMTNLSSGQAIRLTLAPQTERAEAWSPRGDWLAFTSLRTGYPHIYRLRPTGTESGVEPLTFPRGDWQDDSPSWSPDQSWIVFQSLANSAAKNDLFMVNVADKSLHQLTNTPDLYERGPSWSNGKCN
ncbi:MAG: protein kinase [Anaerolineae bacterium]